MDGDMAPLKELASMAGEQNLKLIVDEAHSTGIYGKRGQGMVIEQQLQHAVFARVHTFGKALGCHGATVVGSAALRQFLINFSRPFIYTTSMPPYGVLTIKYVLRALEHTNQREILKGNIRQFRDMVNQYGLTHHFMDSSGPIQCLVLGSVERIMEISSKLRESNFDARAILSPTVPEGKERIRFCIHSYNTSREIQEILFLLSTFV
jgi:8-amino-7-oxononanoate synthase